MADYVPSGIEKIKRSQFLTFLDTTSRILVFNNATRL